MKGIMLDDYNNIKNSHSYKKGQEVEVKEQLINDKHYYVYHDCDDTIDWIPKNLVQFI